MQVDSLTAFKQEHPLSCLLGMSADVIARSCRVQSSKIVYMIARHAFATEDSRRCQSRTAQV